MIEASTCEKNRTHHARSSVASTIPQRTSTTSPATIHNDCYACSASRTFNKSKLFHAGTHSRRAESIQPNRYPTPCFNE
ncbi:hypothetical protein ElyMa_000745500 [Elysia marginata]|uniref:C2H2-type domain-containing protein n=1 Tax=Elysia marginata TaxID=1093978 RepID=A0AAV4GPZ5_9GAST|nr:hypothetical protein ElyMa_000745500 [Elysia marginata]